MVCNKYSLLFGCYYDGIYLYTYTYTLYKNIIWVRSWNCGCLVTWFCYQLIAKPGNKAATVPWPAHIILNIVYTWQRKSVLGEAHAFQPCVKCVNPKQDKGQTVCIIVDRYVVITNMFLNKGHSIDQQQINHCPTTNTQRFGLESNLQFYNFDGLVQDCSMSSILVMEILQSGTKPSTCAWVIYFQHNSVESIISMKMWIWKSSFAHLIP